MTHRPLPRALALALPLLTVSLIGCPSPETEPTPEPTTEPTTDLTTTDSTAPEPEPACGDGMLDDGEECDDGNLEPGDGCDDACLLECGNGALDGSEECDDGNLDTGDGCDDTCAIEPIDLGTFPAASFALGQPDLQSVASNSGTDRVVPNGFRLPLGPVQMVDERLYLIDSANSRLLIYDTVPTGFGTEPDAVLGSPDLVSSGGGGPNGGQVIGFARGMCSDGSRLGWADPGRNRVQIFDPAPVDDAPADLLVGQPTMADSSSGTSSSSFNVPFACAIAADRLVVADWINHRVLIWDTLPTENQAPADRVLGQTTFDIGEPNQDSTVSATGMNFPENVWTDGERIVVSDVGNHRVLVWNTWPTNNAQAADLVMGQPDFTTADPGAGAQGLNGPTHVMVYGEQLLIADTLNNRVLVHEAWPTTNHRAADQVIGQSDFDQITSNDDDQDGVIDTDTDGAVVGSARSLNRPTGVQVHLGRLWVTDAFNNRIVVY